MNLQQLIEKLASEDVAGNAIAYLAELKKAYLLAKSGVTDLERVTAVNAVLDEIDKLVTRLEMTPLKEQVDDLK